MALVLGGRLSLSEEKADLNCFRRISTLFSGLLNSLPFTLSGETPTLSLLLALTKFQNSWLSVVVVKAFLYGAVDMSPLCTPDFTFAALLDTAIFCPVLGCSCFLVLPFLLS